MLVEPILWDRPIHLAGVGHSPDSTNSWVGAYITIVIAWAVVQVLLICAFSIHRQSGV